MASVWEQFLAKLKERKGEDWTFEKVKISFFLDKHALADVCKLFGFDALDAQEIVSTFEQKGGKFAAAPPDAAAEIEQLRSTLAYMMETAVNKSPFIDAARKLFVHVKPEIDSFFVKGRFFKQSHGPDAWARVLDHLKKNPKYQQYVLPKPYFHKTAYQGVDPQELEIDSIVFFHSKERYDGRFQSPPSSPGVLTASRYAPNANCILLGETATSDHVCKSVEMWRGNQRYIGLVEKLFQLERAVICCISYFAGFRCQVCEARPNTPGLNLDNIFVLLTAKAWEKSEVSKVSRLQDEVFLDVDLKEALPHLLYLHQRKQFAFCPPP